MNLLNLITGKKQGMIGVAFSQDALRAVQLVGKDGKSQQTILGWGVQPIASTVLKEGRIENEEEVVKALRALFANPNYGDFSGKQVIISLPEHQCYHYSFAVKKIGNQLLHHEMVRSELEKSLPFDITNVRWDWKIVQEDQKFLYFYALAIPTDVLNTYLKVCRLAGKTAVVVEPQIFSAKRVLFPDETSIVPTLYLSIGAMESTVATIDQFGIHQSSIVELGVLTWASELAKQLSIQPVEAKKFLFSIGVKQSPSPSAPAVVEVLKQGLIHLVREGKEHLLYDRQLHEGAPSENLALMVQGQGAFIPGVTFALAKALNLKPAKSNTWIETDPTLTSAQQIVLQNAIGAAYRGLKTNKAVFSDVNVLYTRKEPIVKKKKSFFQKKN